MGWVELGGIPWETISDGLDDEVLHGEVYGDSGRSLEYRFSSDGPKVEFDVKDVVDPTLHLTANADSVGGVLTLNLNTKGYGGDPKSRHPDMYAGNFVGNVLRILRRREIVPHTFEGVWSNINGYNDNYRQFYEVYDRKKDNRVDAARATWSGRTLGRYFPRINNTSVLIEPAQVLVSFKQ